MASAASAATSSPAAVSDSLQTLAYEGRVAELLDAIARGADAFSVDADRRTPLHWACAGGKSDVLNALLRLGNESGRTRVEAAVNAQDDEGYTPLISAAASGNIPCLTALLAAGADPSLRNRAGQTALHLHKGREAVITALTGPDVAVPAAVDAQDGRGVTALMKAAGAGHTAAARALLAAGAKPRLTDKYGNTALHSACEEGAVEVVRALVEADPTAASVRNKDGQLPLQMCTDARARATLDAILVAAMP